MSIKKSLTLLEGIAKEHNLSKPYVVGGVPRNSFMGEPYELADIDITTGNDDVYPLAHLFANALGKNIGGAGEHLFVYDDDVKYDFSINFVYPDIVEILREKGIESPSEMHKEVYSRDFTVNTLMFTPDFKKQVDLTGKALKDLKSNTLDCPVDCDISIERDPKRILRAFYFKAKYNMTFSKGLEAAIRKFAPLLNTVKRRYASEIINKTLREDPYIVDEYINTGVISYLPMTQHMKDILIKQNKMMYALSALNDRRIRVCAYIKTNLDYGSQEDEVRDIETLNYCDKEENVAYWQGDDEDSEAKKDFIAYIKQVSCE